MPRPLCARLLHERRGARGAALAALTLLAGIGLMSVSGWFVAAAALSGFGAAIAATAKKFHTIVRCSTDGEVLVASDASMDLEYYRGLAQFVGVPQEQPTQRAPAPRTERLGSVVEAGIDALARRHAGARRQRQIDLEDRLERPQTFGIAGVHGERPAARGAERRRRQAVDGGRDLAFDARGKRPGGIVVQAHLDAIGAFAQLARVVLGEHDARRGLGEVHHPGQDLALGDAPAPQLVPIARHEDAVAAGANAI